MPKVSIVTISISQYPRSKNYNLLFQLFSQHPFTCPSISEVGYWSINDPLLFFSTIYSLPSFLHVYKDHFSKHNGKFISSTECFLMPNRLWHFPLYIPRVVSTHLMMFAILFSVLKYFMFLSLNPLTRFFCWWIPSSTFYKIRTMLVMQKSSFIIHKEVRTKWEKQSLPINNSNSIPYVY